MVTTLVGAFPIDGLRAGHDHAPDWLTALNQQLVEEGRAGVVDEGKPAEVGLVVLIGSQMDHGVRAVQGRQPVVAFGHVAAHAPDAPQAVGPGSVRVGTRHQAVQNSDGVPSPQKRIHDVGANEPGSAGYQNVHGVSRSPPDRRT